MPKLSAISPYIAAVLAVGLLVTLTSSRPADVNTVGGPLVPVRYYGDTAPPAPNSSVTLRQLVVASNQDDVGLQAWRSMLDPIGSPYDVVLADREQITPDRLVGPDGVGRYSAVLLASSSIPNQLPDGTYETALTPEEWQALWDYEREFRVRQVALNSSPSDLPEDYCLRVRAETSVGPEPVYANLTDDGAKIFGDLRRDVRLPIQNSYVYYSTLQPGCAAQPILTSGSDVLGVQSVAPDGRERLALTISLGPGITTTSLLGYGLVRWATRGLFLGEQRHWLNVDVDDWFLASPRTLAENEPDTFRLTGPEVAAVDRQQTALRERFPQARDFTLNLAFNGELLDPDAPARCDSAGTPDPLSSYSLCLADRFRWINHTLQHIDMDDMSYDDSLSEIGENLAVAKRAGLPVPADVLKTPEISGLGISNPDLSSTDRAVDRGLAGSNENVIRAAAELGVKYLHGNLSFASHRPSCFNCGIRHPLDKDILVVPDWPTNISYAAAKPDDETSFYNSVYGPQGSAPARSDRDYDYQEVVDAEAKVALTHIISGSASSHTLHQANLHEYAPDSSLTFDWLNLVVEQYSALYAVPLESPGWEALGAYAEARTAHFEALAAGQDAVWNRAAGTVTFPPHVDGRMLITGLSVQSAVVDEPGGTDQAWMYGGDSISRVGLSEHDSATFTVATRLP